MKRIPYYKLTSKHMKMNLNEEVAELFKNQTVYGKGEESYKVTIGGVTVHNVVHIHAQVNLRKSHMIISFINKHAEYVGSFVVTYGQELLMYCTDSEPIRHRVNFEVIGQAMPKLVNLKQGESTYFVPYPIPEHLDKIIKQRIEAKKNEIGSGESRGVSSTVTVAKTDDATI